MPIISILRCGNTGNPSFRSCTSSMPPVTSVFTSPVSRIARFSPASWIGWSRRLSRSRVDQRGRLPPQDHGEVKYTPVTRLALDADGPVHQFHQPRGNGETQAGSAEFPGGGPVGLRERMENGFLFRAR